MKKYLIKMMLAAGFLALFSLKFVDVTIGERLHEYPLETAWRAIGLPLQDVSTRSWMQLENRWMSVYELKNLANVIKNKLNLVMKAKPTYGEQDGVTFIAFEGMIDNDHNTIVAVTIQSSRGQSGSDTQMGITTNIRTFKMDLRSYVENLKRKMNSFGKDAHFKVLLSGEHQGKLRPEIIREFSSKAFQKIKAELLDSAYEAGNSNQKGYTSLLKDSVQYDLRQMNIEIGTRYDSSQNTTQVVLASPSLGDGE